MTKWEYLTHSEAECVLENFDEVLRNLGSEGWEAVGFVELQADATHRLGGRTVLLKRPIKDASAP